MPRIVFVTQEKGGVGKSTIARALAESLPKSPVFEIDSTPRLIELGKRVSFFPMRADRESIERTRGRAARAEFDPIVNALATSTEPTIVDVGGNTSKTFMNHIGELSSVLGGAGIEMAILVVVTADPGALAEGPVLLQIAKPWAKARFVIENRLHGEIDPALLAKIADNSPITTFSEHVMELEAVDILQSGGLVSIPDIDPAKLYADFGIALSTRILGDLNKFRDDAMNSVRPAAEWLVSRSAR